MYLWGEKTALTEVGSAVTGEVTLKETTTDVTETLSQYPYGNKNLQHQSQK